MWRPARCRGRFRQEGGPVVLMDPAGGGGAGVEDAAVKVCVAERAHSALDRGVVSAFVFDEEAAAVEVGFRGRFHKRRAPSRGAGIGR